MYVLFAQMKNLYPHFFAISYYHDMDKNRLIAFKQVETDRD